ncbi:MAG: LPS assembly protein LptD [Desulfuromonadales bacterium]|nr:LPS assembly protein LptD [Desulfuromonadales bacterium]
MRNFSNCYILSLALLASLLLCPPHAIAAEAQPSSSELGLGAALGSEPAPVSLTADSLSFDSEDEIYQAEGDILLKQQGMELQAQQLLWQGLTRDAVAEGDVHLNDGGADLQGESLRYNLGTGSGQINQGTIYVPQGNFTLIGEQIEKLDQRNYRIKDGSFTTCDGPKPDWKFSAEKVDIELGGYAEAKDVWFYLRDVPVFYSPYVAFPVKTERESGFLTPWFGYSSNKGARASLAWYQVIDRNQDATLYLDYLSKIGVGKGLEYRYLLEQNNAGEALYYHVSGISDTPDMYYLKWRHHGQLDDDWALHADVEYVNDELFFDEFGEVAEDYNRDKTVSTVRLQRNWGKLNFTGHGRYIKDLEKRNNETLQKMPELGLGLSRYRLGETPLYLGLESAVTSFVRDKGEDGDRVYLRPSVAAVFKLGDWLEITPEAALNQRLYTADSGDYDRAMPELALNLSTRLMRTFDLNLWGMQRMQHSIEPQARYIYVPYKDQSQLPLFDLKDRLQRQNAIEYALVNRLVGRYAGADGVSRYHEFFNLRLSQRFDIDEERNNRSGLDRPFSDLRAELSLRPTSAFSLEADALFPVYNDVEFKRLNVNARVQDTKGNAAILEYNYRDQEFEKIASDYLKFQLDTSLFNPLFVRFEERYDFRDGRELEKVLGVEYRSKCWSLFVTYRNRYRANDDDDHEVMVNFALAGLGSNRGFGNGFGSVGD